MLATPAPIFSHPLQEFSADAFEYFLSWSRCYKPYRALEKIRIGRLYAGLLFPGHGMPRKKSTGYVFVESAYRTRKDFSLSAAHVGQQSLRREMRAQLPD